MKETQRKDVLMAAEMLIKAIKKADNVSVSIDAGIESVTNQYSMMIESDHNGEQTYTFTLYTKALDKRHELYSRCSKG